MSDQVKKIEEEIDPAATGEKYKAPEWNGGTGAASQVGALSDKLINMNYDNFTKGTDYQSLTKRYSQQGQKAMDDTLGKVAARTGGLASSYAVSASQQQYNDYMSKLEDAARALYDRQRAEVADNLNVAQGMYDRQYAEYQDQRNFGYQTYRDQVANQQWQQSFDASNQQWNDSFNYQKEQDAIANQQWQQSFDASNQQWNDSFNYQKETAAQADAREQAMMLFSQGGKLTEDQLKSISESTGWDMTTIAAYQAYYDDIRAQENSERVSADQAEANAIISSLIASGMTLEKIQANPAYADYLRMSTFGSDYWGQMAGNYADEKALAGQADARARISEYIANGGSIDGVLTDEIKSLISASGLSTLELQQMQANRGYTNSQLQAQEDAMAILSSGVELTVQQRNQILANTGWDSMTLDAYQSYYKGLTEESTKGKLGNEGELTDYEKMITDIYWKYINAGETVPPEIQQQYDDIFGVLPEETKQKIADLKNNISLAKTYDEMISLVYELMFIDENAAATAQFEWELAHPGLSPEGDDPSANGTPKETDEADEDDGVLYWDGTKFTDNVDEVVAYWKEKDPTNIPPTIKNLMK